MVYKKFLIIVLCVFSISLRAENIQTANCSDFYTKGNVSLESETKVQKVRSGTTAHFSISLINNNSYPLVQTTIYGKVMDRIRDTEVASFVVAEIPFLSASSTISKQIEWSVPKAIEGGEYIFIPFIVAGANQTLLDSGVYGSGSYFDIFGAEKGVSFEKNRILLNGNTYISGPFLNTVSVDQPVEITALLINNQSFLQKTNINWTVYKDYINQKNIIATSSQVFDISSQKSATTSYHVMNKEDGVYYVLISLTYQDVTKNTYIRFTRSKQNNSKVYVLGVSDYPIEKSKPTTLFACISDMKKENIENISMEIRDKNNTVVFGSTLDKNAISDSGAIKSIFSSEKSLRDFKIFVQLKGGDGKIKSFESTYSCADAFGKDQCKERTNMYIFMIIGFFIIVFLSIKIRKSKSSVAVLALIFLCSISSPVYAKNAVVNVNVPGDLYQPQSHSNTHNWGLFESIIHQPQVEVVYRAQVAKETGEVLSGGEDLPAGTVLNIKFIPHVSTDVKWTPLGGVYGSSDWSAVLSSTPYGGWGDPNMAPSTTCDAKDLVYSVDTDYGSWQDWNESVYTPLIVKQPVKTLSNLQNLTCSSLDQNGEATCTVGGGAGPVSLSFNYATTTGKFYYRARYASNYEPHQSVINVCLKPSTDTALRMVSANTKTVVSNPYQLTTPAQSIEYSFNAVVDNQPPTAPDVQGPTEGLVSQLYDFSFVSTDPDNDQVKYGIDWNNDLVVDEWFPGSGFIDDELIQNTNTSWSDVGSVTFNVLAEDSKGATSGWTQHSIYIRQDRCSNISGAQPAPLFSAHGRDYFQSLDDGKLYFTLASAPSASECQVDMCADTSAIEEDLPSGYIWDPSGTTPYQQYSCIQDVPEVCSCSGRTYNCSDNGVQTSSTPNAPECSLVASCSYDDSVQGSVTFNFSGINILGTLQNAQSETVDIPEQGAGVIPMSRTLMDSFDGQQDDAYCEYDYFSTDPKIVSFSATKIVNKGEDCLFSWITEDMTSCTLGGQDLGTLGNATFSTVAGKNISKTLSCVTNEEVPRTISVSKTCFIKPNVIEK